MEKELFENKKVGPPCVEDYNKWAEDNPDYYYGVPQNYTVHVSDINSDKIDDKLYCIQPEICNGGNGESSALAMLVYSDDSGNLVTEKDVTDKIQKKIKSFLIEKSKPIDYALIQYSVMNKNIFGEYVAWSPNDAHCCPSYKGYFEYNPLDLKITVY